MDLLHTPLKDLNKEQRLVAFALYEQRIGEIREENRKFKPQYKMKPIIISDDLKTGVNGLINHADGKHYDSKSAFRQATRKAGCYEVGSDMREPSYKTPLDRGVRGDFNVRPELKRAIEKVLG